MVELEIEILLNIRVAWDEHIRECPQPPKAVLLNPGNFELIGWHEVLGVPVLPDPRVKPKFFRLLCGAGCGGICAQGIVWWDDAGVPHIEEEQRAA